MTKRRRHTPAPLPGDRRATWSGLRKGDPVDVLDPRERGATWVFDAYVTNESTAESWVEVVGGRRGEQRRRAFRPDQVYPHRSVRGRAATTASLDEAPQLPLSP